ncbi:hypothetical protein [Calothrix sp. 336/3]|uniref:hypothetical protein n=1 Tax=Calothrix sp. 336/3 TaxID=1337936 RepID=UPI00143A0CA6|nr:hypothetical protein [Calothrix sp. 336/3]
MSCNPAIAIEDLGYGVLFIQRSQTDNCQFAAYHFRQLPPNQKTCQARKYCTHS